MFPCNGFITFKEDNDDLFVLIVQTPNNHQGFAKGKRIINEFEQTCANRERTEETGINKNETLVLTGSDIYLEEYNDKGKASVKYFIEKYIGDVNKILKCENSNELENINWIPINNVYKSEYILERRKEILRKAVELYKNANNNFIKCSEWLNLYVKTRAFISGHTNMTEKEFKDNYEEKINNAINLGHEFVIGNASGCDTIALNYLLEKKVEPKRISIYFYSRYPSKYDNEYYKAMKVNVICEQSECKKFLSYEQRDKYMTINSDYDIAWIRSIEENKKIYGNNFKENRKSGTEQNIERRRKLIK